MEIVIATANKNKLREIKEIFGELNLQILSLQNFPEHPPIIEDGKSFAENALKKAQILCNYTGFITIADDSGLSVDCLGGMPGVFSARYAGNDANDKKNNEKLLRELKGVPAEKRGASFMCTIAIVEPSGRKMAVKGEYRGIILSEPRGKHGFGYDPVFLDPVSGLTFAEMTHEHKNKISHRARALQELKKVLPGFLQINSTRK